MSLTTIVGLSGVTGVASMALNISKSVLIETIKLSSNQIKHLLENNPDLRVYTDKLDLYAEMKVIDAIVGTLPETIEEPEYLPLKIAITNLKELIDLVHKTLDNLNQGIIEHNKLYFSTWRTPSYLFLIDDLTKYWECVQLRKATLLQTTQYLANNKILKMNL